MTHEERCQKIEELWLTVKCAQAYAHKFDTVSVFNAWDADRIKAKAQKLHDELFPEQPENGTEQHG